MAVSKKLAENRARASANHVLRALSISDPESLDVNAIACMRNVLVDEAPLKNCDGRLVIRNSMGKATVNSAISEPRKKRFVAAHELGHFEMHRDKMAIFNCTEEYFDLWRKQNPVLEREANVFASELLMPSAMFEDAAKGGEPNFETIKGLGEKFDTTLMATALRFIDHTGEACAVVCVVKGEIRWVKGSELFGNRIRWGSRVGPGTYAHDFFDGKALPIGANEVLATAWFGESGVLPNATIQEHSVGMPKYQTVLSVLWITDDIDEPVDDEFDENFTPDGRRYRW